MLSAPDRSYSAYLGTHDVVLRSVRLYLALGLVMLLGSGALIDALGLLAVDPRGIRYAFAGVISAVLASTVVAPAVVVYVREILFMLAAMIVVWLGVLLGLNAFAPTIMMVYFTMAFTGGALFGIAFRGVGATLVFLGVCVLVAAAAAAVAGAQTTDGALFLACLVAVSVVVVVTAAIRERLTESLEASRRRYAEAEAAGGIGSWSLDLATGEARWSDGMCALVGVPPLGDRPAPSLSEYLNPDDLPAASAAFEAVVRGDMQEHAVTVRVATADGHTRALSGVVRAECEPDGRVARVVGVATDVTAQAAHQSELLDALDRAESAARLKTAILANMSHEIRTPLTAVLGFAELLAEEADAGTRTLVEPILTGGQRLLDTLNSVLDLARLESDGGSLDVWPLDLRDAAHAARAVYAETATLNGLTLRIEGDDEPVPAFADAPALGRVIDNLLSNALRFTDIGGVTVRAFSVPGRAVLEVCDTGRGMAPAFCPRAFDAFVQESEGDARSHEGSGLGLAIVQRLVEAMGGEVTLESALGEGTCVRVSLPAAEAQSLAVPRAEPVWVARRRLASLPAEPTAEPAQAVG